MPTKKSPARLSIYDSSCPLLHASSVSNKAHTKIEKLYERLSSLSASAGGDGRTCVDHANAIKDKPSLPRECALSASRWPRCGEDETSSVRPRSTDGSKETTGYTDPEEACKPGAVAIHEDFANYRKVNFIVPGAHANIAEHFKLRTGDVAQGFKASDLVLEERYFVPMIQHAAMEPHSAHAQFDKASGRLTIWVANDAPFRALHEITEALNMPKEKVRFINPAQGGGFGSKGGLKVEPIAVALAFHTNGRPVRVKFNREETFISTLTRHEAVVYSKTGRKRRHPDGARDDDLLGRRRLCRKKPDGLYPR